jgi:hypothetical protein
MSHSSLCVSTLCSLCLCGSFSFAADKPAGPKKLNYQDNVQPILREKCFACHDADKIKGGLDMTTFTKLMEGGGSGVVVKPGDSEGSRLFQTVSHKAQPFMPPKSDKIPQPYIDTIKLWIEQGALENSGSKVIAMKPKADVGLSSVVRGRPPVVPMPKVPLSKEPVVTTARADAVTAMAASPWAPLVAIGGQKQILLYNTDTQELLGILPFPYGKPNVVKFSRNGSLLLAAGGRGGASGKAVVWSVLTGEKIIEVGDETDAVLAADISADQTQIALGGPNKLIRLYSTKDGEKIRDIKKHTDWIYALEYSPDGVLLASADRNGGVFVWEAFTGREYFSLRGHTAAVTDVSWRDDSNVLATCSEDTTIRLWEMENGGQIKSWGAHGGGVESVKYSHDNRLASVGRDRVPKLWDQNGAQQKAFEALPDVALRTAITHDNARVIAGDWSGMVKLFQTADGKPVGAVSPNPLSLVDQFDVVIKDLAAKQATYDQAKAAADAAAAALQKVNADLAAAQKAAVDAAAAVRNAEAALGQLKTAAEAAKANVPLGQARITAKDLTVKAFTEAMQKVKAAADMAQNDPSLVAEVQAIQKLVTTASTELDAVKKAHAEAVNVMNTTVAKLAEAEKNLPALRNNAAAAAKAVEPKAAAVKPAADAANAAQAAFNQSATAVLTASRTVVEKHKALPPKK